MCDGWMIELMNDAIAVGGAWLCARSMEGCVETTPVGFEPTRGDPISLAGRRLNRSAKVSLATQPKLFVKIRSCYKKNSS